MTNGENEREETIRFSIFEVRRTSGELFKQGRKIKLQAQPFQVLLALLERPGQVATREALRQRIWPAEEAGDFDNGLNRAINKLRDALGDAADTPRFIETLPRRGYRFIAPVQDTPASVPSDPVETATSSSIGTRPKSWLQNSVLAVIASVATIAFIIILLVARRHSDAKPFDVRQLTTNSSENPIRNSIVSPDGKYLAIGDLAGVQVQVIATGESHLLRRPRELSANDVWSPAAWFPDGTRLLVTAVTRKGVAAWTISLVGETATLLRDDAFVQSVSPDGSTIAFIRGLAQTPGSRRAEVQMMSQSEIWLMNANGESARRLKVSDGPFGFSGVRWSPDGRRIAYRKTQQLGPISWSYTIESCDLKGEAGTVIYSNRLHQFTPEAKHELGPAADFQWLPSGSVIVTVPEAPPRSRSNNLWQIKVSNTTGNAEGQPRRLSNLAGFHIEELSTSADGKALAFVTGTARSHIVIGRLEPAGTLADVHRLTLDQRYNSPLAWTPDSHAVIFTSDRNGNFSVFRQSVDERVPEAVRSMPAIVQLVRSSPDGSSLIYSALLPNSQLTEIARVPAAGGPSIRLFTARVSDMDCAHIAGGSCVFSEGASFRQLTLDAFDPKSGVRRPLFRVDHALQNVNWTVSPDGTHLAMTGCDRQGRIEIRTLTGAVERAIQVQGGWTPSSIDWAADGKTLFTSSPGLKTSPSGPVGETLLQVDMNGVAHPLWETTTGRYTWSIASPDGKYLAICEPETERNAWIVENF